MTGDLAPRGGSLWSLLTDLALLCGRRTRLNQMSLFLCFSFGPPWKCIDRAKAVLRGPHKSVGCGDRGPYIGCRLWMHNSSQEEKKSVTMITPLETGTLALHAGPERQSLRLDFCRADQIFLIIVGYCFCEEILLSSKSCVYIKAFFFNSNVLIYASNSCRIIVTKNITSSQNQ